MDEIEVIEAEDGGVEIEDPVFVEGLPGVGHVGKLVGNHIVEELDSTLMYEIYTQHFPPQCTVDEDGMTELVGAEVHHCDANGTDLIVLTGDHQSQTLDGHYKLTDKILDIAEDHEASRIYAMGGIATGELIEDYSVRGASNNEELIEEHKDLGVEFGEGKPEGGIVGVSGLLLGLGKQRGFNAVCLMGETSGYMVDPKSAQVVLEVLMNALDFEVDMQSLEDRAEEMEEVVERLEKMNSDIGQSGMSLPGEDDLRYIG